MDATSLKEGIKSEARCLGFQFAGVTNPAPPPHLDIFERWLAAGRFGEMAYLADERNRSCRADPRQILPECCSILVLGIRYPAPGSAQRDASGAPKGQVAAYAWGEDYHQVLPQRMKALVEWIERKLGKPVPNRCYTDTGPLLERDLAQRAGLGWIGKNTCLIVSSHGSYFFLAEILLGLELEPDPPFLADRCGSCRRCLDACPTACILPDRTLDARRCISYLTIEQKGPIPFELRHDVGTWIFGCDICQQVCPWNQRFAVPGGDPAFTARPDLPSPDLLQEAGLSAVAYQRKFKNSPVKRSKRGGYLRNVIVAIGNAFKNQNDAKASQVLFHLLTDPEPLIREHAAWALGRLGGEAAREALITQYKIETHPAVLQEIRAALSEWSMD